MLCKWKVRQSQGGEEPQEIHRWAEELNISSFLARLLWHRGLTSLEDMDIFLGPNLRHLSPLEGWPDLIKAADILSSQLVEGRKVAIWGDYDVDGVTSVALVADFLKKRGYQVITYLPDRMDEGYGLNVRGIEYLAAQGVGCLLTADCGTADGREVLRARELGMTVIISDHHLPGAELPAAEAIVNPCIQDSCPYPKVSGVGVAFVLMAALNHRLPGETLDMRNYLDLVALGTIADIVDLTGENRILVKNGLLLLQEAKRPGIFALKEVSGFPPTAPLGSDQVGFSLAPRLNAAGRIGAAHEALELLLAPDVETARPLAVKLDNYNQQRRKLEEETLQEAIEQAESLGDSPGLVLYDSEWHQGVIGIVASRIVDRFYRPTLLLTRDGDSLKGSGRSINEFDLYQGLRDCSNHLLGFGGHRQAAGLSLQEDLLEELRKSFNQAVKNQVGDVLLEPSLHVEAKLGLERIDLQFVKEIDLLQPFGPGNPQPLFCSKPLKAEKYKTFGNNHASLQVRDEKAKVTMLGKIWRQGHLLGPEIAGRKVELAFLPRLNHYDGLTSIDLQVKDWRILD